MENLTIATEWKRRMDLVNCENFKKECVKLAKQLGITAKEWNENKAIILLKFANDFCSMENKINK